MQIPNTLPQFMDTPVLIATVGKERGELYFAENGIIEQVASENEPSARYSDREGFFMHAGGGMFMGAGEPYRDGDEQARNRFIDQVVHDLRGAAEATGAQQVYLFEPEHLKGGITSKLQGLVDLSVTLVAHGNFVGTHPEALLERINTLYQPAHDPEDPESVAGEKNEGEKRKILETGKRAER